MRIQVDKQNNISLVDGAIRHYDPNDGYRIVFHIIQNTPWVDDSSEAFGGIEDIEQWMDATNIHLQGFAECVDFRSNTWIFEEHLFNFWPFPEEARTKIKKFVQYLLIPPLGLALSTVSTYIRKFARIFKHLDSRVPFSELTDTDYLESLKLMDTSARVRADLLRTLIRFYSFLIANYPQESFWVDLKVLEREQKYEESVANHVKGKERKGSIPTLLWLKIQKRCIEVMRNIHKSAEDRIIACVILLYSWLGLRPEEVPLLTVDSLRIVAVNGKDYSLIWYQSPKLNMRWDLVFGFPLAVEAIMTIRELRQRFVAEGNPYLIPPFNPAKSKLPYFTSEQIHECTQSWFYKYMKRDMLRKWEGLPKVWISSPRVYISAPSLYRFRVYLCTYLVDKGFDPYWVERNMGHLSQTMRGVYYRSKSGTMTNIAHHLEELLNLKTNNR